MKQKPIVPSSQREPVASHPLAPGVAANLHAHDVPVWGCDQCLRADKAAQAANAEAAAKSAYIEWKKTYSLPMCPECGDRMEHYEIFLNGGKWTAVVVCMKIDSSEGISACGDQDIMVVIA